MGSPPIPAPIYSALLQSIPEEGSWHSQGKEGWRSWHGHFPHLLYLVQQGSAKAHGHQGLKMRVPTGFPAIPAGIGGQGFEPQSLQYTLHRYIIRKIQGLRPHERCKH